MNPAETYARLLQSLRYGEAHAAIAAFRELETTSYASLAAAALQGALYAALRP
jgi:cell division inhibitor SulA